MTANGKRLFLHMLAALLCALLTGCMSGSSAEELYRLPKLPNEYASLEMLIDEQLSAGAEHAAPTSGSNLQSVQMTDLDGDGVEEAVAFFRRAEDEKPMKVYFFRSNGDRYEQYALIEGTASSLYSIAYHDLDGDGRREILIGFKSGTEVQVLSVYSILHDQPRNILTTAYSRYAASDLDGDGQQELTVFYSNGENDCMADCYVCADSQMVKRSTLFLSFSAAELSRVTAGTLSSGEKALFATGVLENSTALNDILIIRDGLLKNAASDTEEAQRFLTLYPTDIDGDGVTEVPETLPVSDFDALDGCYSISWRQYDADGRSRIVCTVFHDAVDGWKLQLPEKWIGEVRARRMNAPDESAVLFFRRSGDEEGERLLIIRTLTGSRREAAAVRGGAFVLSRQMDTVYSAELLCDEEKLSRETVQGMFSLISAEWATGEN